MRRDVASLVVGLVACAVAAYGIAHALGGASLSSFGVLAPVTLIIVGVVGLLASRRNHKP